MTAKTSDKAITGSRRLGLRGKMVVAVLLIVCVLVGGMGAYFSVRELMQIRQAAAEKTALMRHELRRKGMVLARNVAVSSERAIVFRNYVFLKDVLDSAVEHDRSISYGVVMDESGMALIHSDVAKAGLLLDGEHDLRARQVQQVSALDVVVDGVSYIEAVAPVVVGGKPWGKVRFGLNLDALNDEIRSSEQSARERVRAGIATTVATALTLMLLGAYLGRASSRYLTGPLDLLLAGARRIQQGDLHHRVEVAGIPEFELLARQFNDMTAAVLDRQTALEEALRKSEEAHRLKTEFLANMSHELRTPLNAIVNVPTILMKDFRLLPAWTCSGCRQQFAADGEASQEMGELPQTVECPECGGQAAFGQAVVCSGDPAEHLGYLEMSLESGKHLLQVVTDLLEFSKLDAGKMRLRKKTFPVRRVVEDVRRSVSVLAEQQQLQMQWATVDEDLTVHADDVKLAQILINLISNAIKFTTAGGQVSISADGCTLEDGTENVRLVVQDTGEGIPADKLHLIFESFRQIDGGHTRKHGGTGLGLAITKQLVELHGGTIEVRSTVGAGSTFTVVIPRRSPEQTTTEQTPRTNVGRGRRVVVVDDDATQLRIVDRCLTEAGFDVVTVRRAPEALEVVRKTRPHVLISDVLMPDLSGLTLLRQIREDPELKDTAVIMSSAFANHGALVDTFGAEWLSKPWSLDDVVSNVQRLCDGVDVAGQRGPKHVEGEVGDHQSMGSSFSAEDGRAGGR